MVDDVVFYVTPLGFIHKLADGILSDKEIKFKEGYDSELIKGVPDITYNENEQFLLDEIKLPVEKDIFKLIHYPTNFIRFCLKSKAVDVSSGAVVDFDMSLVPDLYRAFGYVVIPQWTAPGHKLELYPDSFYAGYLKNSCNGIQLMKTYCCKSCLDIYKGDLDILAKNIDDTRQRNCKELLGWCGVSLKNCGSDRFAVPYNVLFITHVDHGVFGYPNITDVSDWIKTPAKSTAFGFYDKDGNSIE
jgi:hypothetical protein